MSEPKKPLRPPVDKTSGIFTQESPNILLGSQTIAGTLAHSVRQSELRQVPMRTRIEWSETAVDEHAQVFKITARNTIDFSGNVIEVLNDATDLPGFQLPPSNPTAAEYLAAIGQEKMIYFDCALDPDESRRVGRQAYKVVRSFMPIV